METFQVLSMLKIDEENRNIPLLTYTADVDGEESEDESAEPAEPDMFATAPVLRMH
jgi:hypothetical protein